MIKELDAEMRIHNAPDYRGSLLADTKVEEVIEVPDAPKWRDAHGNKSSSSDSEEDTESEMDPSKRNENYLQTSGEGDGDTKDRYELPKGKDGKS